MRQKLVDAALRDFAGDREQAIWLEADEPEFADVALDVRDSAGGRHQAIHAGLRILLHLLDAPAVVRLHIDPRCRSSEHEKMRFPSGIQAGCPLLQSGQIRLRPAMKCTRRGLRKMLQMEHVDVSVEDAVGNKVLQFLFPNLLVLRLEVIYGNWHSIFLLQVSSNSNLPRHN